MSVKYIQQAFDIMKRFPNQYVYIGDRTLIEYQIIATKVDYYLSPIFKDSNIFNEFMAIAFNKNNEYFMDFNKL